MVDIRFSSVKGRRPLDAAHLADMKALVSRYADDIVSKWVDFFVLHKRVNPERITRRLK